MCTLSIVNHPYTGGRHWKIRRLQIQHIRIFDWNNTTLEKRWKSNSRAWTVRYPYILCLQGYILADPRCTRFHLASSVTNGHTRSQGTPGLTVYRFCPGRTRSPQRASASANTGRERPPSRSSIRSLPDLLHSSRPAPTCGVCVFGWMAFPR